MHNRKAIADLELRIANARVSFAAVLRMAQMHPSYFVRLRAGEFRLGRAAIARIKLALWRVMSGVDDFGEGVLPTACYRLAVAHVATLHNVQPQSILSADPARRATADPEWLQASHHRRLALYIANTYLNIPQAALARAAGLTKSAVCQALRAVEDRRDSDLELEALLATAEEAFSA